MNKRFLWWILAFLIGVATTLSGHPIYDGHFHVKNFVFLVVNFAIAYILFWHSNDPKK